jgi:hypothetical protein
LRDWRGEGSGPSKRAPPRRRGEVQSDEIVRDAHGVRIAPAFFARVTHRRRFGSENAAAETMRLDDDPMILVVPADDQTGRLLNGGRVFFASFAVDGLMRIIQGVPHGIIAAAEC